MPEIVLCPKCGVRVEKDKIGEFLCPKCGLRLCPNAHNVPAKSRICPMCGWKDTNYYLWQEAQKNQRAEISGQPAIASRTQQGYKCSQCLHLVSTPSGPCPHCGDSRPRLPVTSSPPVKDTQTEEITPKLPPMFHRPRQEMQGAEPRQSVQTFTSVPEDNRTISVYTQEGGGIHDYADQRELLQGEHWIAKLVQKIVDLPPYIKYLLLPMAGLIAVAAIVITVNPAIVPTVGQKGDEASHLAPPPPIFNAPKLYAVSARVTPEGGGIIRITPPSESGTFESGVTVRLTAIPDECYTFSYWEGVTSESSEATVTVDSNKSITANFRLKDTTPPTISEVRVPIYSDTSATISWNTDKPTKGQVEYGKTEAYGLSTSLGKKFATSHNVRINDLQANTTYYFKVNSQDKCGNKSNIITGKLNTLDIIPFGHEVGDRPPNFTLQEYQDNRNPQSPNNGEMVSLSDFRGKKILLNFWNTFCGACIGEFPAIRKIYEDPDWTNKNNQDSDLVVLTVCTDGRADRIEKLEDKYQDAEDKHFGTVGHLIFPILLDVEEKTSKDYSILNIPCTVFIDSDGIIRDIKIGRFTSLEEIRSKFDSL